MNTLYNNSFYHDVLSCICTPAEVSIKVIYPTTLKSNTSKKGINKLLDSNY